MIEFFHEHVNSTFIIHFFKSSPYKSSFTTSWTYYNIYDVYSILHFLWGTMFWAIKKRMPMYTVHDDRPI